MLCKGECPQECDENQKLYKPLARLEIFNSLKVIAPQIEAIDRPRKEEENNEIDADEDDSDENDGESSLW